MHNSGKSLVSFLILLNQFKGFQATSWHSKILVIRMQRTTSSYDLKRKAEAEAKNLSEGTHARGAKRLAQAAYRVMFLFSFEFRLHLSYK